LWLGCGALGLLGAAIISKESKAAGVAFGPEPVTKAAGLD
jgi:hypothetical protein